MAVAGKDTTTTYGSGLTRVPERLANDGRKLATLLFALAVALILAVVFAHVSAFWLLGGVLLGGGAMFAVVALGLRV